MPEKLNYEMKALRNTGTFAAPVWSELDLASAVQRNLASNLADMSARKHGIWQVQRRGQNQPSFSISIVSDDDDSDLIFFRNAYFSEGDQTFEMGFANGDPSTSGTVILRLRVEISSFSQDEPAGGGVTGTIEVVGAPFNTNEQPQILVVP